MQYKSGCSWKERKWNEKAVSEEVWPSNWQAASLKITVLEIESKNVLQIRMGRIPDNPWAEHLGWLRWRAGICPESHSFVDKHRPHHGREKKNVLRYYNWAQVEKGRFAKLNSSEKHKMFSQCNNFQWNSPLQHLIEYDKLNALQQNRSKCSAM